MAAAAIAVLGIAVYANTLSCPFVFDDKSNIRDNPYIRLTRLDATRLADAAFRSPIANRPASNLSFALNYYFGRYDVAGYHAVNIGVHVVNGYLVYLLALTTFRGLRDIADQRAFRSDDRRIAFLSVVAALVFVAHPLQTQSVTYIVQRMNSMATMFYLLALLLYIAGRRSRLRTLRWSLWAAGFVSWILALGSKEIAATLPFVVLLYEWCFFQDLDRRWLKRSAIYALPLVALTAVAALLYLGDDPWNRITDYRQRDFSMGQRVVTQCRVVILYVGLLAAPLPARLNLTHAVATSRSLLDPVTTLLGLLLLSGLLIAAACGLRRHRLIGFCVLWFFVNLVIESSVVPLEMVFEHRLYLPMVAAALGVSWLLGSLTAGRRSWEVGIATALIVALGAATHVRNRQWRDPLTLWSDAVVKSPRDHRGHTNLGIELASLGRLDEAIGRYDRALDIRPHDAAAHNNLGLALATKGRLAEAFDHYRRAVAINPDYADALSNLGTAFAGAGRIEPALRLHRRAVQINPHNAGIRVNLAIALGRQGRVQDAIDELRRALRIDPDLVEAHTNMGIALAAAGNLDEAIVSYRRALDIRPNDARAHNNLGVTLVTKGNVNEAIHHYRRAVNINRDYADAHNNMGAALAGMGRLDEALHHVREALRIDPDLAIARDNLEAFLKMQNDPER